jgi:hypothetical protein
MPETPLCLDKDLFTSALRTSAKGSSPGPGGATYEHLRVLLDDPATFEELFAAAQDLARADVPGEVADAYTTARLTALRKHTGGVRGIATGTSFRRLVARTLARQFGGEIEEACSPYQFALSTRAGTDCVGHVLRVIAEGRPSATVASVDGIGAYDYVSREAMLSKLASLPNAGKMLPFLRLSYGKLSAYDWTGDDGVVRQVVQGGRR